MPLQNRVTPFGQIVADPARGTMFGNRGCLHDQHKRLTNRRWTMHAWVACVLAFKDRHRPEMMMPGRYTELFFLDEATALAAGHRPCCECRRADYKAFLQVWRDGNAMQGASLQEIDRVLHAQRTTVRPPRQITHRAPLASLPDGVFVAAPWDGRIACLVRGDALLPWSPAGYGAPVKRGAGNVTVLTPSGTVAAIKAGFAPVMHTSATASS